MGDASVEASESLIEGVACCLTRLTDRRRPIYPPEYGVMYRRRRGKAAGKERIRVYISVGSELHAPLTWAPAGSACAKPHIICGQGR